MLAGAQNINNARPLTPVRASPDDCNAVMPSSFLNHQSVKPTNPNGALPSRESLLQNHHHGQERLVDFWRKWVQLYLHYLQKRHSQRILQKNFQVGDLVLLVDHPTARGHYPLARVVQVHPSEKGITQNRARLPSSSSPLSTLSLKSSSLIHPLMMIWNLPDSWGFPPALSIKLASAGVLRLSCLVLRFTLSPSRGVSVGPTSRCSTQRVPFILCACFFLAM